MESVSTLPWWQGQGAVLSDHYEATVIAGLHFTFGRQETR